jgi:hypothetical protein
MVAQVWLRLCETEPGWITPSEAFQVLQNTCEEPLVWFVQTLYTSSVREHCIYEGYAET